MTAIQTQAPKQRLHYSTVFTAGDKAVSAPIRSFTVHEYHQMAEIGVLNEDEPIELIDGVIILSHPDPANPPRHSVTFDFGERAVQVGIRPFTADEYERMIEAGVLAEDERLELIDGVLVEMSPIGGKHLWTVNRLNRLLGNLTSASLYVSVQNPVRLDDGSQPQPDVALIHLRAAASEEDVPTAKDVLMLIEVADTSLDLDRNTKLPLYAQNNIPEVWIVNLNDQTLEAYTKPKRGKYQSVVRVERGDSLILSQLPNVTLKVDDILGKAWS